MQRFVTYIYAYDNGQKSESVGYAKVETRGNRGRVDVYLSSARFYRTKAGIAFCYVDGGRVVHFPIGEMEIESGAGNGTIIFETDALPGTNLEFDQVDGIYIVDADGRKYLSFWKDVEVTDFSEGNFKDYSLNVPTPEIAESLPKEVIEEAEQESLHTLEIPMRNIFPSYTLEDAWRNFEKKRELVSVNEEVKAIRIELNDLRELPKKYWYLGNNSFLLHGFFGYHYLFLGKLPEGMWFLGVPGIYERQERVMASVFGFPGFLKFAVSHTEKEMLPSRDAFCERQQGMWYHILED